MFFNKPWQQWPFFWKAFSAGLVICIITSASALVSFWVYDCFLAGSIEKSASEMDAILMEAKQEKSPYESYELSYRLSDSFDNIRKYIESDAYRDKVKFGKFIWDNYGTAEPVYLEIYFSREDNEEIVSYDDDAGHFLYTFELAKPDLLESVNDQVEFAASLVDEGYQHKINNLIIELEDPAELKNGFNFVKDCRSLSKKMLSGFYVFQYQGLYQGTVFMNGYIAQTDPERVRNTFIHGMDNLDCLDF